jgi:glycosyltransferase involved in cell wall biosynthesis
VAPGHALLSTSGSTRNILAVASALGEWADVTVVFRSIAEELPAQGFRIRAIEPRENAGQGARDDVAARGMNPFDHLGYLRRLRRFAVESAGSYDLVLEKGWRLSGYLASAFIDCGVAAVLIENAVHRWQEPIRSPRSLAKFLVHIAANRVSAARSRNLPLIIAETEQLKAALETRRRVSSQRIEVVGLGVDHTLFRPMPQDAARAALGIPESKIVMLYVGGMDEYHDLSPLLEALRNGRHADLELHLVGEGEHRARYEQAASASNVPIRFHGRVPHVSVPEYIAASDVCLAPYPSRKFHGGEVGFSTLKIPEYMACARPVISVPSGHILSLIEDQRTGFLFANEPGKWKEFLARFPSRSRLAQMGRAAAPSVEHLSWRSTAQRYLELCRPLVAARSAAKSRGT